ncbi:MAG: hypothetical protein EPN26_01935 [Rhodospirillales bacterium]|nr:MAG: hypothetical protein EPN26_01935 [Rhodospirillales bacterium]
MQHTLAGLAWACWWALIGRSLYHANLVRQGRRRFWSLTLAWELMIAIGMGVVAGSAAEYLQLTGMAAAGFRCRLRPSQSPTPSRNLVRLFRLGLRATR